MLRHIILSFVLTLALGSMAFANPITDENVLPGTTDWSIDGRFAAGKHEIEGYARPASAPRGTTIGLHISAHGSYTLIVYRMGWYQGHGGRQVFGPVTLSGGPQPIPGMNPQTGLIEAHWPTSYTLPLDPSWISGVYLVKLTQLSSGLQSYIIFTIREDTRVSDVLFDSSIATYQAYNSWGGKSLYCFNSDSRKVAATHVGVCANGGVEAVEVSFDRPYDRGFGVGDFSRWEQPLLSYLESQGYDLTYTTSVDLQQGKLFDLNGNPLHKAYLSTGHDEYWSLGMRTNVTAMRDAGVGLGFMGGNPMSWQVRFAPDSTGHWNRTMIGYKVDWMRDPLNKCGTEQFVSGYWDKPRGCGFIPPPTGELAGVDCNKTQVTGDVVISDASNFLFAGTGLNNGDHLKGLLGFEANQVCNNTAPAGTVILSESPDTHDPAFVSNMATYMTPVGSLVIATGTMNWGRGESDLTIFPPGLVDPRAQKTTNNIVNALIR